MSVTSYVSPAGCLSLFSREVNVLGLGALSKDLTPLREGCFLKQTSMSLGCERAVRGGGGGLGGGRGVGGWGGRGVGVGFIHDS